jgi:hypothetical protein
MKLKLSIIILAIFFFGIGSLTASALTYDLGINPGDIGFSKQLVAGQPNRIYATIHNVGTEDVSGYVTFYQGDALIGNSQPISVRANGFADEVYVDWTAPAGSFNIRADINGQNPKDENASNDQLISSLFVPLPDTDGDSNPDEDDNDDDNDTIPDNDEIIGGTDPLVKDTDNDGCLDNVDKFPLDPALCIDTDGDGIDDKNDPDDDNDGWSDEKENKVGTDPKNPDSDKDGYIDSKDYCPMYATCTVAPEKKETISSDNNANLNTAPDDVAAANSNLNQAPDQLVLGDNEVASIDLNDFKKDKGEPLVTINAVAKDWQTFIFTPDTRNILKNNLSYSWDFGDGETSNAMIAEHKYAHSGDYRVSLKILADGQVLGEKYEDIHISFFNLGNIYLTLSFGALILVLIVSVIVYLKSRGE